jgi:two-component system, OmpR family, sensor kinase
VVGRRLARPVDAAAGAAHLIAAGDLAVRLPKPADEDRDELAGLARSINAMAEALERSKDVERQFLLSISHDLRTPLTSIRGYAGAIVDGTAVDAAAAAEVILAESARLQRLVSDLLDLARLDSHTFSLHPVERDLRITLVDAVRAAVPTAARQGIALTVDDGGAVPVVADEVRVRQLLGNLLENATKYASATVAVHVFAAGEDAVVLVDDDGPGIAVEDRPHVFDVLYVSRLRPARSEAGSGLGLAIVRQLAEAMGGSVRVDSSPSGGARMEVRLPLASAPESMPVITRL